MTHQILNYREAAKASINDDIERLTNAIALIGAYIMKTNRNNNDCEQALRLLGGEVAWLRHKWNEAQEYLTDDPAK